MDIFVSIVYIIADVFGSIKLKRPERANVYRNYNERIGSMRLFIAINFNTGTRNKLIALCDELRSHSERGGFSLPENLHLTLAFLGECDDKQTAAAKAAMDTAVFDPFEILIDRIGRFKRNHRGGDIWWVGIRENKNLLDLQQNLTSGLRSRGFNLEKRKYNPHITLAREVKTDATPRSIEPFGEPISMIDLMKSERINEKLTYTSIYQHGTAKQTFFFA